MIIKLFSFLAMAIILAVVNPEQQDKEYAAKLSVNEWQVLIADQNDVPKNQRDKIIAKVVTQLQTQLAADTIKKK